MSWNLKYQIQINVNDKICRNPTLKCVQLENIFIEQFPYPYISNSPDYFILGNMSSPNFCGTSCIRHPRVNRFWLLKCIPFYIVNNWACLSKDSECEWFPEKNLNWSYEFFIRSLHWPFWRAPFFRALSVILSFSSLIW